jgi:hypothetical protein
MPDIDVDLPMIKGRNNWLCQEEIWSQLC